MEILKEIVTVVVPCFNNETTIGETIESVLNQTINQWELICVDDGSTDNTVDIIKTYSSNDNRIKVIQRDSDPKGGSHCRNIGAFAARGSFLIFLDGDDLLAETCIENRLKSIVNSKYDFVVFPMGRFIDDDLNKKIKGTKLYKNRDYLYYYASGCAGWQVTSPIIKTSFFIKTGGFNTSFKRLQDIEFYTRALSVPDCFFRINYNSSCDCFYRRHVGNKDKGIVNKYEDGLRSYKLFLDLLTGLDLKGAFVDKAKLSKSVACVYCNACILIDLLCKMNSLSEIPDWLKKGNYSSLLMKREKIVIRMLLSVFFPSKLNTFFARIIIKYFSLYFKK